MRKTTRSWVGGATVALAALAVPTVPGLAGVAQPAAARTGPGGTHVAPPQDTAGKAIFHGKGLCFACHGQDGVGTPVAPDLTDDSWINFEARPTAEQMQELVKTGVPEPVEHPGLMPPMGGAQLTDEEIAAVVGYVLGLSGGSG